MHLHQVIRKLGAYHLSVLCTAMHPVSLPRERYVVGLSGERVKALRKSAWCHQESEEAGAEQRG